VSDSVDTTTGTTSTAGPAMKNVLPFVIGCAIMLTWPSYSPTHASGVDDLKHYHGLINMYREGNDEAVTMLLLLDQPHLRVVVNLANGPQDPFSSWEVGRFYGAAMLHTEAALRLYRDSDSSGASFHLEMAVRLLQTGGTDVRPFASRWYVAVSRYLRDVRELTAAQRLLEMGRQRLPRDSAVLYESGTLAELVATESNLLGPAPLLDERDPSGITVDALAKSRMAQLTIAAGWLQQSLKLDDTSFWARLHLGRVQTLRGKEREGIEHLEHLLRSTSDHASAYLVALFIGAAYERLGASADAVRAYRLAVTRYPRGRAACVALSALLRQMGQVDESRSIVKALLSESAAPVREPWSWYLSEPPGLAKERLGGLRAEVVR